MSLRSESVTMTNLNNKKLAIIGASYLQLPLSEKAKQMGCITYVFAWKANDVGEHAADFFFPISIVEKEQILEKCIEIGIDGICSIASDLAMVTVNYVAEKMNLFGNSILATEKSTNKYKMRQAFRLNADPSPRCIEVNKETDVASLDVHFPAIVKPTDRSGSRGVCRVETAAKLREAVGQAFEESFEKKALIEEYITGKEYSVEYISFQGKHYFLAVTEKYTTGSPYYIETGHVQPAIIGISQQKKIRSVVEHALDSLELKNGASHSEVMINGEEIKIIEIGGRMGGDLIGSHLVPLATGYDYLKAVISVALGVAPEEPDHLKTEQYAAVRFVLAEEDIAVFQRLSTEHPEYLMESDIKQTLEPVRDSSTRKGYYLFAASTKEEIEAYLPKNRCEQLGL